jgi:hypothetical protein
MSLQPPLVSAGAIWFAYLPTQTHPGDNASHVLDLSGPEAFGNGSLFANETAGVALTHRALVNVDVHASCEHEVAIERHLAVQLDKGASGGLMERGTSCFVAGEGNAAYQGILEQGHVVRTIVSAPGDEIAVTGGYVSVTAQPI